MDSNEVYVCYLFGSDGNDALKIFLMGAEVLLVQKFTTLEGVFKMSVEGWD